MTPQQRERQRARMKRWRLANQKHLKAYALQYAAEHRERCRRHCRTSWAKFREKYVAQKRRHYHEIRLDPARRTLEKERRARIRLLCRYGLTGEQYDALLAAQSGGCAICSTTAGTKSNPTLHVDHDHRTGKVRGLLCQNCNTAIGAFQDDPALLRRASAYLETHSVKKVA
jgi:hypothetical protein